MSRSFTVRLTPAQYDALMEQAQAQGFSGPGTYIRAMVLERPEASRRDLIALLGVLGRSGHRLIELTRQLDAQATPSRFLEDQLAEVLGILRFSLGEILTSVRSLP